MRRVRYVVAASLDGYIAGPDHDFDWIPHDPTVDFEALFRPFDTVLCGRRSYEVVRSMGHSPGLPGMRALVFSRTLRPEEHADVEIHRDPLPVVRELRRGSGKDIWLFGGGTLFRMLAAGGLVDTVEVSIVPILLGRGIPLAPALPERIPLRLTGHHVHASGIVTHRYQVVPADHP